MNTFKTVKTSFQAVAIPGLHNIHTLTNKQIAKLGLGDAFMKRLPDLRKKTPEMYVLLQEGAEWLRAHPSFRLRKLQAARLLKRAQEHQDGTYIPEIGQLLVDRQCRLVTGNHTIDFTLKTGIPILVKVGVCLHGRTAIYEGDVQAQALRQRMHRTVSYSDQVTNPEFALVFKAAQGMHWPGKRNKAAAAKIEDSEYLTYMELHKAAFIATAKLFEKEKGWTRPRNMTQQVVAAIARLYYAVPRKEFNTIGRILVGKDPVKSGRYAVVGALHDALVRGELKKIPDGGSKQCKQYYTCLCVFNLVAKGVSNKNTPLPAVPSTAAECAEAYSGLLPLPKKYRSPACPS